MVTIWDGFRVWLRHRGLDFDYTLYSNYERQVEELVGGSIDVAWNSPLAWVRTRRMAPSATSLVMRDTDQDLVSVIVVPADSSTAELDELEGATVGVGAIDSPQATLLLSGVDRRHADHREQALRCRRRPPRRPHRRRAGRGPSAGGRRGRRGVHERRHPP